MKNIPYLRSCSSLNERILIQMTKLIKLCEEEGYNNETLNPARNIVKDMRSTMGIRRVVDGMVEYNHPESMKGTKDD